jgi:acetoin:2,6-dichlorophenolindophenol oxidoreductase subunit alpha
MAAPQDASAKALQDKLGNLAESEFFTGPEQVTEESAELAVQGLNSLADPAFHTGPLDITGWPHDRLRGFLHRMLTIRAVEDRLGQLVESGDVVCPVHLAIGQEAIPVAVSHHLTPADRVFGAHRSHGHYLALGGDIYQLFAEVLGRADGCSHGMGGSMHLFAPEVGFMGSVPIVAATVPVAVGAALAAKMDNSDAIAVTYFGDGAAEEGVVHESLNLASQMKLPVLFVCENNLYASHMDIAQRQPSDSTARFAQANNIPYAVIDGNDVAGTARAAGDLITAARNGGGPGYLEAVTYRWRGHVGPDENIDVGIRRSPDEIAAWKRRDPVARLVAAMTSRGDISGNEPGAMADSIRDHVADCAARALEAPYPDSSALLDLVYADTRRPAGGGR